MKLTDLQREAHAIAKDHGWWDEPRSFGDLIALVHSELSEALEAYRVWGMQSYHTAPDGSSAAPPPYEPIGSKDWKPEGVAYELADVVIRVADMVEHYRWALCTDGTVSTQNSFGNWIALVHYHLAMAYGEGRDEQRYLNAALAVVYSMATHYGIDLDAAIETKMKYNRGRSYRHVGKAL